MLKRETYSRFQDAARRAQEVAVQSGASVSVERASNGWAVMVPAVSGSNRREDDDSNDHEMDAYLSEVQNEIWEEISSDTDDWHRSEEDGWYYED
ncbi:MAG: hypothetical protein ABIW82_02360 [Dokdonella sp.]